MFGLNSTQSSISDHIERLDEISQGVGEKFLGFIQEARTWKAEIIDAIHQDKRSAEDRGLIENPSSHLRRITKFI
tara:strand:- start:1030 stop:1254 length:225 start_codon:yes stop_codon:yes gene_type:complete